MNTITAYLIDVNNRSARRVEITPSLSDYYEYLDCDCIDITARAIGGRYFDIIVDDEDLLKRNPIPSAFDADGHPALVGNLLVVNHNSEGEETSLTESDIEILEYATEEIALFIDDSFEVIPTLTLD